MTVEELLNILQNFHADQEVYINVEGHIYTILDLDDIQGQPMMLALEPGK
jgi:hypothetical protein